MVIKNILICTPLKGLLPKNKKDTLIFPAYLVSNSNQINGWKYKELDFRWANKSLLAKDYLYLESLYEKCLKQFALKLNLYHKSNYSIRFWRILIGPWLSSFLFIIYDKFYSIKDCLKKYNVEQINFLDFVKKERFIPGDMDEYIMSAESDPWHQYLSQEIIKTFFLHKKKIKYVSKYKLNNFRDISPNTKKSLLKNVFSETMEYLSSRKSYKYFINSTYLGTIGETKLSYQLNQLPIPYKREKLIFNNKINNKGRCEIIKKNTFKNTFEKNFFNFAIKTIPIAFLEGYKELRKFNNNSNYPDKPKAIFSSNNLWYDTFSMYYTAQKTEKGCKLIYGQHGGCYGINSFSFLEKHEIKISDKYLSWGWERKNKKVQKLGIISNLSKLKRDGNSKGLLILFRGIKKFFVSMESGIGTEPFKNYASYCTTFYNNLSSKIIKDVILRPQNKEYQKALLKNLKNYNDLNLSKSSFSNDCNKSKLIINTCNSTPFLQLLSMDFPSITIWDKKNNPIRKETQRYVDLLYKNNLLFYDPKKAAKFVNKIWIKGVEEWWNSKNVRYTIKKFSNNYSKKNKNIISDLTNIIKHYEK